MENEKEHIQKNIKRAIEIAGSQKKLADKCGVAQQTISKWFSKARVPSSRVLLIEKTVGISRYDLRPDLYPRE